MKWTSAILLAVAAAASAQVPDYDFQWKTIGAPGNTAISPDEIGFLNDMEATGRVESEFRMSQTEVTVGQWFDFVNAYAPFAQQNVVVSAFTGRQIYSATGNPSDPQFTMYPGTSRFATDCTWLNAARYCNWLHNGKVNQAWAFESGAYDMSSFVRSTNGLWQGNGVRAADAKFWIPNADEWIKAMYFDPNKYGTGNAGYWTYPISSDSPPISGAPGTPGAQTSAGWFENKLDYYWVDVGSYPNAASPWGLLDGSGGRSEYIEGLYYGRARTFGSSSDQFEGFDVWDVVGSYSSRRLDVTGLGFRVASVPSTGGAAVPILVAITRYLRRRR
jgi:hypothetical protein